MIKKRIISLITIVLFGILVCCLPVMADGSFSWSQDANRSKAEVTYFGNVNWLDKGIAPNRYTFFAKLYGKDKSVVTVTNAAYLTITSGVIGKIIFTDKIYWNHEYSTTQKKTTATSIRVQWGFDGFSGYKSLS